MRCGFSEVVNLSAKDVEEVIDALTASDWSSLDIAAATLAHGLGAELVSFICSKDTAIINISGKFFECTRSENNVTARNINPGYAFQQYDKIYRFQCSNAYIRQAADG